MSDQVMIVLGGVFGLYSRTPCWTHYEAVNDRGIVVDPWSPDAVAWSLPAMIDRVCDLAALRKYQAEAIEAMLSGLYAETGWEFHHDLPSRQRLQIWNQESGDRVTALNVARHACIEAGFDL